MPAQYEAIRDKLRSQCLSMDEAQSRAAAIYNSKHPKAPVGPNSDNGQETRERRSKLAHK